MPGLEIGTYSAWREKGLMLIVMTTCIRRREAEGGRQARRGGRGGGSNAAHPHPRGLAMPLCCVCEWKGVVGWLLLPVMISV